MVVSASSGSKEVQISILHNLLNKASSTSERYDKIRIIIELFRILEDSTWWYKNEKFCKTVANKILEIKNDILEHPLHSPENKYIENTCVQVMDNVHNIIVTKTKWNIN